MKDKTLYRSFQEHLDAQPVGFPEAEDGSDLRVLKAFFTPEEARIAMCMNAFPATAKSIFRKMKRKGLATTVDEAREKLDAMLKKGLIHYSRDPGSKELLYMLMPLAVGFFEFSIDNLTKEMAEAMEQYMGVFMHEYGKYPQMRTIPISTAIEHENAVLPYDDVFTLIEAHPGPFGVADCICTQEKKLLGHECKHGWTERCLTNSKWYIKEGHAREITKEEILEIVKRGMDDGLVVQPGNYKAPGFLCLCCSDCCGILTNARKFEDPSQIIRSNYFSEVDEENCTACGLCQEKCPMDAITVGDHAVVELKRCIGCGVCTAACEFDAIRLKRKEKTYEPPETMVDMFKDIMKQKIERRTMSSE
ncbi:MAG: 4Fe-4S binding protein [Promethearchaeota archaeon]